MLTASQVQADVYRLLKGSPLAAALSGDVYQAGYRPRDSKVEDAVIIFSAGNPSQIDTGVVAINIFVPDIDPNNNGVYVKDGARALLSTNGCKSTIVKKLTDDAHDWIGSLFCGYTHETDVNPDYAKKQLEIAAGNIQYILPEFK